MIKIASCSATKHLFDKITNQELVSYKVEMEVKTFADGEISIQYMESIRGRDLFLFGDTSQHLTELLLAIDGAKRSSCKTITVILPYYGYGRQDKKDGHRGSLGASVMAQVLQKFGVSRVVSIDLHADQIQGMFEIPVEHIKGHSIFAEYILNNISLDNTILCSPDGGSVPRVSKYCPKLDLPMVSINKHRARPNEVESMDLIGSVAGKNVIIIDDMADTCNTMIKAVDLLKEQGALNVYYLATHPVLSGKAFKNIHIAKIEALVITDTINVQRTRENDFLFGTKIVEVSCMPVLERVIINLIHDESVSRINE